MIIFLFIDAVYRYAVYRSFNQFYKIISIVDVDYSSCEENENGK